MSGSVAEPEERWQASPLSDAAARGPSLHAKRVGMVTFSPYPWDPRPYRAVAAFLDEGATVDLVCLSDGAAPKRESLNSLEIFRLPIDHRRGGKLAYLYQYSSFIALSAGILARQALKRAYDVVYVHNMPDILVLSAMFPKMLGAKVILDLHDPMPELMTTIFNASESAIAVRLLKRMERWSMARADLVLTVNIACKRIFSARSCRAEKIGIVMNSPDEKVFPSHMSGPAEIRKQRSDGKFVIMYHGSLVERNGLELAVDALQKVRKTMREAELRIYGRRTPFLDSVMQKIHGTTCQDAVRFLGPRALKDLVPEIHACDVGVIPNLRNAFTEINTPTRIFEYLALGKPVIAPRTPGILDYFDNNSLIFFEAGNSEDLAEKIRFVRSHPGEVMETIARAQQVYFSHTWSRERRRLIDLVSGLLAPQVA
jgi:glycosyltransferase involved in cell wall biosynthesis